jgi:hypothetical protein
VPCFRVLRAKPRAAKAVGDSLGFHFNAAVPRLPAGYFELRKNRLSSSP